MQIARWICRNVFNIDLLAVFGETTVRIALFQNFLNNALKGVFLQEEIDESRTSDFDFLNRVAFHFRN